ncbi:MAG: methyltransferase domain-containing protein [Vicinamibacterales bacterium]|nr:methyltransferase domain-containing protein [Vicinamibacterales bacterium]
MAAEILAGWEMVATESNQRWNPDEYDRTARFVSDLGADALALLDPSPGERILDLGCGDGVLTERIIRVGARVVALDSSAEQVTAARGRGVDARVGDAASLEFQNEFDAVFSNAVLHWIRDVDAVLAGVHRTLRSGGRFVAEFGGAGNIETVRLALVAALNRRGFDGQALDPWYFPGAAEYSDRLEAHGFVVEAAELFDRPTRLTGDMLDWLALFGQRFFAALNEGDRPTAVAEVCDAVRAGLQRADGTWMVDYVRLRVKALKADDGAIATKHHA